MRRFLVSSLVMSSLILGISKAQAATINIDSFEEIATPPNVNPTSCYRGSFGDIFVNINRNNSPVSCAESGLSEVETIGGSRTTTVTYGGLTNGSSQVRIQPVSLDGIGSISVNNFSGGNSTVKIEWNGEGNGLLSLSDLEDFAVGLVGVNNPNNIATNIRLEVTRAGNTSISQQKVTPTNQTQKLTFTRASFSDPNVFNGVVDSIAMILTGDANNYLIRLDYITATSTPEPSLAIGLVLIVGLEVTISYLRKKN